jgi:hypothetical protein
MPITSATEKDKKMAQRCVECPVCTWASKQQPENLTINAIHACDKH